MGDYDDVSDKLHSLRETDIERLRNLYVGTRYFGDTEKQNDDNTEPNVMIKKMLDWKSDYPKYWNMLCKKLRIPTDSQRVIDTASRANWISIVAVTISAIALVVSILGFLFRNSNER